MSARRPAAGRAPVPCRSCGQPVLWALTAAGRWAPIEPQPDPLGVVAVHRDVQGRLRVRGLTSDRPAPEHVERRATPHTCEETT